jgi:hypothetical protein
LIQGSVTVTSATPPAGKTVHEAFKVIFASRFRS